MGSIQMAIHIDAPPDLVVALLQQVERIPEWQYNVRDVKDIDGPMDHVNAAYTLVYRSMGCCMDRRIVITQHNPPEIVEQTATTTLGGRIYSCTHFEPAGNGADVHWRIVYRLPGGFFGVAADKLLFRAMHGRAMRKSLVNLKAVAEGKPPTHGPLRSNQRR
jgi:uncharacterized membrane protein